MKVSIHKSEVKGDVRAPSSKSYTIRGLICAALAGGESEIVYPLSSDDTEACLSVLRKVGIHVRQAGDVWQVTGGEFREPDGDLFCGESAATLRFMTAVCSLIPGQCRLVAAPGLLKRPIEPLVQALRKLGVNCSCPEVSEGLTVVVNGGTLKGGEVELPGDISSQFVSALLFIAPFAEQGIRIKVSTPLESEPFVLMTIECLREFGVSVEGQAEDSRGFAVSKQAYRPGKYQVEGDWSSASYFLALGALSGEIEVENLNLDSLQGDRMILDFLRDMGASVELHKNSLVVRKSRLKAIQADLSNCIDLLPTMAVLAAAADGASEFTGIDRARIKESNRVAALGEGLGRMGVEVAEEKDRLTILGGEPKGSVIDVWDDHRIAMAFGILGSMAGETIINDAGCVSKTFPQFWDAMRGVGGGVTINGR
jgi:3-phosphoshikimate 1-carboxyvinyltransferase